VASLLLCLFTGPRSESAYTVRQLARAALDGGHRVQIFLGGEGTFHFESLQPLRDGGARVVMCSADAAVRGWDRPGAAGRGSFVDLGSMAAEADAMASFGCVATLDGRVVVRDGPSTEDGWLALRVATALTFTGRPVRAVLDGNGAGWAAADLDARDWLGGDAPADLDGLVDDADGTVLVGAATLATHGLGAVRSAVRVVDDAWQAASPVPPPPTVLHVVTQAVTDPLAVHAIAADSHESTAVCTLGLHDGVYEAGVLARTLGEAGVPQVRLCADDCRRRGVEAPPSRADEYPAIVDAILAAAATFVW
jgi:sulfur relay (sulfurtransferase) complex TusBCD TusD component (DsrE family)